MKHFSVVLLSLAVVAIGFVRISAAAKPDDLFRLHARDLSVSTVNPSKVELFVPLANGVRVKQGSLSGKAAAPRIFWDLKGAVLDSTSNIIVVAHPLLAQVRLGQFDAKTVRVVLDLKQKAQVNRREVTNPHPGLKIEVLAQGASPGQAKVQLIAIDPGHGGDDPGAIGPRGLREKDVALTLAKKLKRSVEKDLGVRAMLTRSEDVFVDLETRAKLANQRRADLFVSIHCNADPKRKLRGIQTFFLDTMKDAYDRKLAARENAISLDKVSDLEMILLDLSNRENHEKSSRLAGLVQNRLVGQMSKRFAGVDDLGVRTAVFLVLFHAEMPSILVETSFISHREEERRLGQGAYQDALVQGILLGLKDYLAQGDRIVGTL